MMYWVWVLTLGSVGVVSTLSLIGVFTLLSNRELQKGVLLHLVSFSVGGLFGGAFFHLIPEAIENSGFTLNVSVYILLGIIVSFLVERCLKWRHCHVPTSDEHPHPFAYVNLLGDAVHNAIDGMVIGGSYLASASMGLATTVAVCLHEIPQEIGDFGVLLYAGFNRRTALIYNLLTALMAFVGAAVSLVLSAYINGITTFLIPFTAGNFIYIAGSDLIPELHSEEQLFPILGQLSAMILGIALLFVVRLAT